MREFYGLLKVIEGLPIARKDDKRSWKLGILEFFSVNSLVRVLFIYLFFEISYHKYEVGIQTYRPLRGSRDSLTELCSF